MAEKPDDNYYLIELNGVQGIVKVNCAGRALSLEEYSGVKVAGFGAKKYKITLLPLGSVSLMREPRGTLEVSLNGELCILRNNDATIKQISMADAERMSCKEKLILQEMMR
jgi:hypothetical protein